MQISSFVSGWNQNNALKTLESIVSDTDSDILLFPGGFIEGNSKESIKSILKTFKGMAMVGLDTDEDASPVITIEGKPFTFRQSCCNSDDAVNKEKASEQRIFDYKAVKIAAVSCGELLNSGFCKTAFSDTVPDLLFGLVHYAKGLNCATYRARLNQFSKIASFYTYHADSFDRTKAEWEQKLSPVPVDSIRMYPGGNIAEIRYNVDTSKTYKFSINRKIREF
jgi:hypothetical protein